MTSIDWNKSDRTIQHRHGPCGLGNSVFSDPCILAQDRWSDRTLFDTGINTPDIPDHMCRAPT